MNVTILELTQATIEFSLAAALIVAAILLKSSSFKNKSFKYYVTMFLVFATLLTFEGFAYLSRGNTAPFFIVMTRLSNFIVFFINFFIMTIFIRYLYVFLNENDIHPPTVYKLIVDITFFMASLILIVNLFTNWMYYFDEFNYYHRNWLWYVYTSLSVILPIVTSVMLVKYRKSIGKSFLFSITLFVWFPIIALIIQLGLYGYSILSAGMSIDLFFMLIFYLNQLRKTRIDDEEMNNYRTKKIQNSLLFTIVLLVFTASIISCIASVYSSMKSNSRKEVVDDTNIISESINFEFLKPLTVSDVMSNDSNLKSYLIDSNLNESETEIKEYLSSVSKGFDYDEVYIVNSLNHNRYNKNGFVETFDSNVSWYREFIESDDDYTIRIEDSNPVDVILNKKISDNNGTIGVIGIELSYSRLIEVFNSYEREYSLNIALMDKDGTIKISKDESRIGSLGMNVDLLNEENVNEPVLYESRKMRTVALYLNEIGYYILVDASLFYDISIPELIIPSIIIYVIGLIIMGMFFNVSYIEDKRSHDAIVEKHNASLKDEMTGLFNRSTYERDYPSFENKVMDNLVIIQIDINGLKQANDTLGHDAGDELIIGAAEALRNSFGRISKIYRMGGDEFSMILYASKETVEDNLKVLEHLTRNFDGKYIKEISISTGVVYAFENPGMSFDELVKLADSNMYKAKEEYYSQTGKNRRKR